MNERKDTDGNTNILFYENYENPIQVKPKMFTADECDRIRQKEVHFPKVFQDNCLIFNIFSQKHQQTNGCYVGLYEVLFGTGVLEVNGELDKRALKFFDYKTSLSSKGFKPIVIGEIHDIYHQLSVYAGTCVVEGSYYKAAICYAILVEFSSKRELEANLEGLATCFEKLNVMDIANIVRTKKTQLQIVETINLDTKSISKEHYKKRVELNIELSASIDSIERTTAAKAQASKNLNNIANVHTILELDVVSCFDESLVEATIKRVHEEYLDRLDFLTKLSEDYDPNSDMGIRLRTIINNTNTVKDVIFDCKYPLQNFYAPFYAKNILADENHTFISKYVAELREEIAQLQNNLSQDYMNTKNKNKVLEKIRAVEGKIVRFSLNVYAYQQNLLTKAAEQLTDELPWGGFLLYRLVADGNQLNLNRRENWRTIEKVLNGRDAVILQNNTLYHARYDSGIASQFTIVEVSDSNKMLRKMFDGDTYTCRKPIIHGTSRLATRQEFQDIQKCLGLNSKPWDAFKDRNVIRDDYIIGPIVVDLRDKVQMGNLYPSGKLLNSHEAIVKITYGDNGTARYFQKIENTCIRTTNQNAQESYIEMYPDNSLNKAFKALEAAFWELESPFEKGFNALCQDLTTKLGVYEGNNRILITRGEVHTNSIREIKANMNNQATELYSQKLEKLITTLIKCWEDVHLAHLYPDSIYRNKLVYFKQVNDPNLLFEKETKHEITASLKGLRYSLLEKALLDVIYSLPANQVTYGWHSYNFDIRKIIIEKPLDDTFGGYVEKFKEGIEHAGLQATLRVQIATLLIEYSKCSNTTYWELAEKLAAEFLAIECTPVALRQKITTVFYQLLEEDKAFITSPGRFFYLLQFALQVIDESIRFDNQSSKLLPVNNHNLGVEAHDPEFGSYKQKFESWIGNIKQFSTLTHKMIALLQEYSACYGIHRQKTLAENLESQFKRLQSDNPEKIADILKEAITLLGAQKTYNPGCFYHLLHFALQYVNEIKRLRDANTVNACDDWELVGEDDKLSQSVSIKDNEVKPQITHNENGELHVDAQVISFEGYAAEYEQYEQYNNRII